MAGDNLITRQYRQVRHDAIVAYDNRNYQPPGQGGGRWVLEADTFPAVVSINPALIVARNVNRGYLLIQNRTAFNLFLSSGSMNNNSPNFPGTHLIIPDGFLEWDANILVPDNENGGMRPSGVIVSDIYAVGSANNITVSVTQGIWKLVH